MQEVGELEQITFKSKDGTRYDVMVFENVLTVHCWPAYYGFHVSRELYKGDSATLRVRKKERKHA